MIPLIVWGIGLAIATIVGGTIYTVQINNIIGKRFAILGARATGKTTLHSFLSSGKIPSEYVRTQSEIRVKDHHFKLDDLKLRIKSSTDISGSIAFEQRWKNLIDNSDYVCYLINTDKIEQNNLEYKKKVIRHIDSILRDMENIESHTELYLIFSFCDLIPEFIEDNDRYIENFKSKNIDLLKKRTASFFGNLNNPKDIEDLCVALLGKISEKK